MLSTALVSRVFRVQWNGGTGTAFTVDIDNRQYLVSAKHVFIGIRDTDTIQVFNSGRWIDIDITKTGVSPGTNDVIVLSPSIRLSPPSELGLRTEMVYPGQDISFYGYPFGHYSDASNLGITFPLPLVKKGCFSGSVQFNGETVFLLDGINNKGFSGGPVLFIPRENNPQQHPQIMGIISGYQTSDEPVYHAGATTPLAIQANTGLIVSYPISLVTDIVSANPNGYLFS